MKSLPKNLTQPDPAALAHSQKLLQLIRNEIAAAGGQITFARYMELALYAPGLGYYSAGLPKLGEQGDFVTAPEISPLFSRCIARQCQQVLTELQGGSILEFGAGSGVMAADILLELERQNCLPDRYFILDISADLQHKQRQTLEARIPHLLSRVEWLTSLPTTTLVGVIIANEVLDAMPVQRFCVDDTGIHELYVGYEDNELVLRKGAPSTAALTQEVARWRQEIFAAMTPYVSEVNLLVFAWLNSIKACLGRGLVLLIDYGFNEKEYYHPDRSMGTLMCHYQHRVHADPLILVGLQDITAHVDFTAVALHAHSLGLHVAGYTSQAAFLLACGLLDFAGIVPTPDLKHQLALSQLVQKLTSPNEMGELFKVLALTYGLPGVDFLGFSLRDMRASLE